MTKARSLPDRLLTIIYSAVKGLAAWVFIEIVGLTAHGSFAGDYNSLVLEQIKQMPQGGRYSVSHFAKIRLQSSAHFESGKFFILPSQASPSFCSGATYLVFIRTIEALRARGQLQLDYSTLERLIIRDQRDGEGIWVDGMPMVQALPVFFTNSSLDQTSMTSIRRSQGIS